MGRETSDGGSDGAIPLLELPASRAARIAEPPAGMEIPRRLGDLGFVPGTQLAIVRRAPFGDPIELEIRGYRMCLRAAQVRELRVIPEASHS